MDGGHAGGGVDLIVWAAFEPVGCVFEANMGLYVNDTVIVKNATHH